MAARGKVRILVIYGECLRITKDYGVGSLRHVEGDSCRRKKTKREKLNVSLTALQKLLRVCGIMAEEATEPPPAKRRCAEEAEEHVQTDSPSTEERGEKGRDTITLPAPTVGSPEGGEKVPVK